jgi:hypothetical protein
MIVELHAGLRSFARSRGKAWGVEHVRRTRAPDLDPRLSLLERLLASTIVPVEAKLAAVEGCLSELDKMSIEPPNHVRLRLRLREKLRRLKAQLDSLRR